MLSEKHNSLLVGAIVGGVAGAFTALMLAPKSGKDLRHDLASTFLDLNSKGERWLSQLARRSGAAVEDTAQLLDKAQALYNEAMEIGNKLVDQIKQSKGELRTKDTAMDSIVFDNSINYHAFKEQ